MSQFELLTGPILLGTQFNWALLGTLTLQIYMFHVSFPKEKIAIKALVYSIFILDLLQTALSSHFAYGMLVTNWGNPAILPNPPWTNAAIPVITGLVSAPVQFFFAWRIYVLKKDSRYTIPVCSLIIALALIQSATAMAGGIKFDIATKPIVNERMILILGEVWLITSVVCDVLIASSMLIILSQYRQATPWKETDRLITKLTYHTIETGAVTAVVAIVDLAFFFGTPPGTYLAGIPSFMLGKIYSNVMMANLNARTRMDGEPVAHTRVLNSGVTELRFMHTDDATSQTAGKPVTDTHHIYSTGKTAAETYV
ncbi:hypothetical protein B0H10DRAFT_1997836 [Mycena sp. CBHHK59/15]|nr:hypothetical protein B0H10DRAFT_1997836 [Mycena sp. CBHHK59/15]